MGSLPREASPTPVRGRMSPSMRQPLAPGPHSCRMECLVHAPGSTVPLKETIEAFDKLAKGEFDHLPEQAFFLIGGLDDLAKKAETLGAKL